MVGLLSEALTMKMSWVWRSKAALTGVHTEVVEVGEVLPCVLTWVVGVAGIPSWEIVVVAEKHTWEMFIVKFIQNAQASPLPALLLNPSQTQLH